MLDILRTWLHLYWSGAAHISPSPSPDLVTFALFSYTHTEIGQSMEVIHISMTRKEGGQFARTSIFVSGNSFPNLCLMYCPTKLVYLLLSKAHWDVNPIKKNGSRFSWTFQHCIQVSVARVCYNPNQNIYLPLGIYSQSLQVYSSKPWEHVQQICSHSSW